jgi:hypothetical protein
VLDVTAFEEPNDFAEHFKERYGPTLVAQANARRGEREAEFNEALNGLFEEWNRGSSGRARFESSIYSPSVQDTRPLRREAACPWARLLALRERELVSITFREAVRPTSSLVSHVRERPPLRTRRGRGREPAV